MPVEILLVDDSVTDVLLAREAIEQSKILNNLHVVSDGVEAMVFLRREGRYRDSPTPNLILLDLNLPKKDGREVLAEIKSDPAFRHIPVVILSTSRLDADIQSAYQSHANCYIVKPVDFEKFTEIVRSVENFWFSIVTLPSHPLE